MAGNGGRSGDKHVLRCWLHRVVPVSRWVSCLSLASTVSILRPQARQDGELRPPRPPRTQPFGQLRGEGAAGSLSPLTRPGQAAGGLGARSPAPLSRSLCCDTHPHRTQDHPLSARMGGAAWAGWVARGVWPGVAPVPRALPSGRVAAAEPPAPATCSSPADGVPAAPRTCRAPGAGVGGTGAPR